MLNHINPWIRLLALLLINMVRMMILPNAGDVAFYNIMTMSGFPSPYYATPLISSVVGILFWLTIVELIGSALYNDKLINYISNNTFWVMGLHLAMFNILNCVLLLVHEKINPISGFDSEAVRASWWYRWETYPAFRLLYFVVGFAGALVIRYLTEVFIQSMKKSRNGYKNPK